MNNDSKVLIQNLDKLHTTEMGKDRIRKNLDLDTDDVVLWCRKKISDSKSNIFRKGKNWYIENGAIKITINASSYTIITAHRTK